MASAKTLNVVGLVGLIWNGLPRFPHQLHLTPLSSFLFHNVRLQETSLTMTHASFGVVMADIIDIAQQRQLEQVRIQPKDYSQPSLSECEECGNDIPPERQKYGAVTLCVACQSNLELKRSLYR